MKKLLKKGAFLSLAAFAAVLCNGSDTWAQAAVAAPPPGQPAPPPPAPPPPPPPPAPLRTISVTGQATSEVNPDQAVISFSVESKDKALAGAKQKNDETLKKLLAITQKYEIPKEKVVTSSVYISPEYNYNNTPRREGAPVLIGYTVSRSIRITTKDLDREEELLSALVEVNIDQIDDVQFGLSEPDKFETDMRVKAFNNAKAKAQALADAAGAKLGPVLTLNAEGERSAPMPPRPMMAMARSADAKAASVAPSMPGAVSLDETVAVTFSLE